MEKPMNQVIDRQFKRKTVLNHERERIGTLADIVIEPMNNLVLYGLLAIKASRDQILTHVALPYHIMFLDEAHENIVCPIGMKKLLNAPKVTFPEKSSQISPDFVNKLYAYYGLNEIYNHGKFSNEIYTNIGNGCQARDFNKGGINSSTNIERAGIGKPRNRILDVDARKI